ncbi:MAG: N-acetylmuramoyl-L-alanine amidase [Myxococcota bacterium]|nr:N-acetylmuramoyl-L-alanine amidase [Myxococcota bacterium]
MLRCLLLVLSLLVTSPVLAAATLRVAVDPGHGGKVEGASGPNGLSEAQICLQVAKRVSLALEKAGIEVLMTRTADVDLSLSERVRRANAAKVDLFISLHANSMPTRRLRSKAQGIETFFLSVSASGDLARRTADRENAEVGHVEQQTAIDPLQLILSDLVKTEAHADSSRLAYAVHQKVIGATGAEDRGVQQAPFFVLNGVQSPAILLELGFISHPEESQRLRDSRYQDKLAQAIVDGVKAYVAQVEQRARESDVRNAAR